jgi:endonuclease/exonuclease/phosphatase family metal-dependent hydrolase
MNHGEMTKETAQGLKVLKQRIAAAGVPPSKLDESINIATWNIREFGKKPRLEPSLHFIAEIIGQFDLVSIVEVRDDVTDLSKVLSYLGPYWKVVFSDYLIDPGGNRERIAFVYDMRAVTFTGLASNAIAPRTKSGTEYSSKLNWWRLPYIASFRAGSFDFILIAAHIRWGETEKGRIPELQALADWVDTKHKQHFVDDHDLVVVGDFNIPSVDSPLYKAVTSRGLKMPSQLVGLHGSDLAQMKRYDQILHDPQYTKSFTGQGGIIDFYAKDHTSLFPGETLTKTQFTYQLSDHLPLWLHVNTDIESERLDQILNPKQK